VIESRIAADKNCHFLLHVLPFFSILVQQFSLGGHELTETKFSLVIVLTEQHAMDNVETVCVCVFFWGESPRSWMTH